VINTDSMGVLDDHVTAFNHGVRTGDWAPMLERFSDDAEMEFVGVPVGPFHGRDAIAEAYRRQPPDDELVVLEDRGDGTARYAWGKTPDRAAGDLRLTADGERITRLVVTFDS
jgi:steroid delta-isomerase